MYYKVSLNNKSFVHITEDDYKNLLQNMNKSFVVLNGETINPSYIVSITKDKSFEPEEPTKEISGHIDEERKVFVVEKTKEMAKKFHI